MLDHVPARLRVIRICRPRYGYRNCRKIHQAFAPEHPIAKGLASPALLAHFLVVTGRARSSPGTASRSIARSEDTKKLIKGGIARSDYGKQFVRLADQLSAICLELQIGPLRPEINVRPVPHRSRCLEDVVSSDGAKAERSRDEHAVLLIRRPRCPRFAGDAPDGKTAEELALAADYERQLDQSQFK